MNCPCCGQPFDATRAELARDCVKSAKEMRAELVMAMRREGYTVREIAARIGRAVSTTQEIIDRERERRW